MSRKTRRFFNLIFRYPFEFVGAVVFCVFFRILPLDWGSAVGGFLGRRIGPRLKESWIARYNLMKAFPEKTPAEIDKIVVDMWDNLIRTFVEYPHLRYLCEHDGDGRIEYVNLEAAEALRDDGKAGILFGGHMGSWEIASILGIKIGLKLNRVYRSANNPYVEWMFRYFRLKIPGELVPKGVRGFRVIVDKMRKGEHFALLIDQKMNQGIEVDFFGFPVMTITSLATLVLKHDYPALPVCSLRLKGAHYRLVAETPIKIEKSGNQEQDVKAFMTEANGILERWIRENPAQWMWVNKRWKDSKSMWPELYKQRRLWKKGIKPQDVFEISQDKNFSPDSLERFSKKKA